LKAAGCLWSKFCPILSVLKKINYDEKDGRFSSPKTVETFFARNLLPAKLAKRFSKCWKIS